MVYNWSCRALKVTLPTKRAEGDFCYNKQNSGLFTASEGVLSSRHCLDDFTGAGKSVDLGIPIYWLSDFG